MFNVISELHRAPVALGQLVKLASQHVPAPLCAVDAQNFFPASRQLVLQLYELVMEVVYNMRLSLASAFYEVSTAPGLSANS